MHVYIFTHTKNHIPDIVSIRCLTHVFPEPGKLANAVFIKGGLARRFGPQSEGITGSLIVVLVFSYNVSFLNNCLLVSFI